MPARRRRASASALLLLLLPLLLIPLASSRAAPVTLDLVKAALRECQDPVDAGDCVARTLYGTRVKQLLVEIMDSIQAREAMQADYSAHVCREGVAAKPVPLVSELWAHEGSGSGPMRVDTLFEAPRGQAAVYLAHDFISAEECSELRYRGGEMDEAGEYGSHDRKATKSSNRKARASTVRPNPHDQRDPIAKLQARVFALANHFRLKSNSSLPALSRFGQEPVNVIEYARMGDEYKLHCDTYCEGTPVIPHGRVATLVMYCEEPLRGGATAFPGIDIQVHGRRGQALLFHYSGDADTAPVDPDRWRAGGVTDNGFTLHTGCPILEGKKLIATQWIRAAVSEEDPWSSYSSVGVKLYDGEQ